MTRSNVYLRCAAAAVVLHWSAAAASAANSFSNALTGFTGNSTQLATQTAVAAAGFNFSSTLGFSEDPENPGTFVDPTVVFDSSGAQFGTLLGSDGGRSYLRTNDSDYANVSFVAEVTWITTDIQPQASYFGLGAAEFGDFRIADWGTDFSAAQLFQEINDPDMPEVFTLKNNNGTTTFDAGTAATGLATGTNRLRLSYDWFRKTADFAIDVNYTGGPFTADVTVPSVNTLNLYSASGWPSEPGRIYFGGDDGSSYKDFQVNVTSSPLIFGDLNGDTNPFTVADWMVLRANQYAELSGSQPSAYLHGDLNGDFRNNQEDFFIFKTSYEDLNGSGSFAQMLSSVPEPATLTLILSAVLLIVPVRRRAATRA